MSIVNLSFINSFAIHCDYKLESTCSLIVDPEDYDIWDDRSNKKK